jgi:hypothetical protein
LRLRIRNNHRQFFLLFIAKITVQHFEHFNYVFQALKWELCPPEG